MEEIEILCEELEEITLEDTREVITVEKPVYPELEDLIVKPTTEEQKFKSNEYGYNNVTVEAIQDENLIPENIKSGTEILGVKGNFTGGKYKPRYVYQPIKFQNYTGTELDYEVANVDTTNFTDMSYMFRACKQITSLDLSNWDTSNVTNMQCMFDDCFVLTELDLSSWNTSNVTNMLSMFNECKALNEIDLSNWDTSNVTNMGSMFLYCNNLKKIDMRNFTFDKVTSYSNVFGTTTYNGVPFDCLIIVKGETEKEWVLARNSKLTNVKTVSELEG